MATRTRTDSLSSAIRLWLLDHPGEHTANDIAAGIKVPNKADKAAGVNRPPVTNELSRMAAKGLVVKTRPEGSAARGPGARYSLAR